MSLPRGTKLWAIACLGVLLRVPGVEAQTAASAPSPAADADASPVCGLDAIDGLTVTGPPGARRLQVGTVATTCWACDCPQLHTAALHLAAAAQAAAAGGSAGAIRLAFSSRLDAVYVDGMAVAPVSPLQLPPGPHRLTLVRRDVTAHAHANVRPGATTDIDPSDLRLTDPKPWRVPWGIALAGGGVAAVAAAIPLIVIDGQCGQRDAAGACTGVHNTGGAGIAAMAVGIASAATGVALLVWRAVQYKRNQRRFAGGTP